MKQRLITAILLLIATAVYPDSPEGLYQAGKGAFEKQYFQIAVKYFTEYIEDYPDHGKADNAYYLTALSYFYMNNHTAALNNMAALERLYPRSEQKDKTNYWAGASYYYLKRYKTALERLENQVNRYPETYPLKGLYLRGICLQKLGQYKKAREDFLTLLKGDLKKEDAFVANLLFQLGAVELAERNYELSLEYYQKLLTIYPESKLSFDSTFYIGECYYFLGNYEDAEKRYLSTLRIFPDSPYREKLLFHLAGLYYRTQRYDQAMQYVRSLEKEYPGSSFMPDTGRIKPSLYFHLKEYEKAVPAYKALLKTIEKPREKQIIHYNLGLSLMSLGEGDQALEWFKEGLKGAELSIIENSLLNIARLHLEEQQYAEAIGFLEDYQQSFPRGPNLEEVLKILGLAHLKQEDYIASLQVWNRLLKDFLRSLYRDEYLFRRALTSIGLSDFRGALVDLNKILKLYPGSTYYLEAYYNIGHIYTLREEYVRAREYYRYIITNKTGGELLERTELALGIGYYNLGEYETTVELLEKMVKKHKQGQWSGSAYFYLGKTRLRFDQLEKAAQDFRKAAGFYAKSNDGAEALYWKGWTEFRLNWLLTAKETFLEIIKVYPTYDKIDECYFRAGLCESFLKNWKESNRLLDLALERLAGGKKDSSLREEVLYQKGLNFINVGDMKTANTTFTLLNKEYPGGILAADGFFRLTEEIYKNRDYAKALAGYEQIITGFRETEHTEAALYKAGRSSTEIGGYKKAIDYFLKYITLYPEGANLLAAFEGIRNCLVRLGSKTKVIEFYKRSISDKKLSMELKNLIRFEYAFWMFNSDREASFLILDNLRNAGMKDPLKSQVNLLIGDYYLEKGNPEGAYYIYKGIAGTNAGETGAVAALKAAHSLLKREREAAALEEYLKVSFLFPDFDAQVTEALYKAYELAVKLGKKRDTDRIYKQLQTDYPQSEEFRKIADNL